MRLGRRDSGGAAFALGAVVAPPDAVAATTVAKRVGMPRRLVSILEGESLVNDATALVALNTAIAALTSSIFAQLFIVTSFAPMSHLGTKRTNGAGLEMSVVRGRPEVAGER